MERMIGVKESIASCCRLKSELDELALLLLAVRVSLIRASLGAGLLLDVAKYSL